ncbi:MAG: hypothetical protein ABSC51_10410 [Gaiellaceae bacterium]|jgi:hypothetical protein
MPPETNATDRYMAEVDRLLGLRESERSRMMVAAQRRLTHLQREELRGGAGAGEAENRALARLGTPQQFAEELRQRALIHGARKEAQFVLAGFVPIALAIVAVAFEVIGIQHFHYRGTLDGNEGFFHYYSGLSLSLPPTYLALKLVLSAVLTVVALVSAEFALAFTRRRRRLSAGLALVAGPALVAAVSLQIALAFEWHRVRHEHSGWLVASISVEVGTVLLLAVFLARSGRKVLRGRFAPLAGAPMFVFLALVPMLAVAAKSGFSSTNTWTCGFDFCGPSPDEVIMETANHEVHIGLPTGPPGAAGAVAISGRRLAVAIEVWRKQSSQPPWSAGAMSSGPVDLELWEARWSATQPGPCGRADNPSLNPDRLSPDALDWCQAGSAPAVKKVASFAKTPVSAVAYRSDGRLALVYSRAGAVWLAQAPSWRSQRLLEAGARSIRLASLPDGDLALAAIVSRAGRSELELLRSFGDRWSQPLVEPAQPGLSLAAGSVQIALLFRDSFGRLVFERRSIALALRERRSFGARDIGALGNLRGGEIGVAVSRSLRRSSFELRIFRAGRGGLKLLSRETLVVGSRNYLESPYRVDVRRGQLAGVVQTGRVVRALYGGVPYGHTAARVAMSIYYRKGRLAFATDWPRWAVLQQDMGETTMWGKVTARWTNFDLTLAQPPERGSG